ncbi:MAG: hypothetical protein ACKVQJ_07535 [Pyrinomonadaceae bacterium]
MNKTDVVSRALINLTGVAALAGTIFGDAATPSPSRPVRSDLASGYDWGFIIGVGLFALAGALVIIWTAGKISKRPTK